MGTNKFKIVLIIQKVDHLIFFYFLFGNLLILTWEVCIEGRKGTLLLPQKNLDGCTE